MRLFSSSGIKATAVRKRLLITWTMKNRSGMRQWILITHEKKKAQQCRQFRLMKLKLSTHTYIRDKQSELSAGRKVFTAEALKVAKQTRTTCTPRQIRKRRWKKGVSCNSVAFICGSEGQVSEEVWETEHRLPLSLPMKTREGRPSAFTSLHSFCHVTAFRILFMCRQLKRELPSPPAL